MVTDKNLRARADFQIQTVKIGTDLAELATSTC